MHLEKMFIALVLTVGYSFTISMLNSWKFNLKNYIKPRLLRIPIIIAMFCLTVYYQAEFRAANEFTMTAITNAFCSGSCTALLTRFFWTKKFT